MWRTRLPCPEEQTRFPGPDLLRFGNIVDRPHHFVPCPCREDPSRRRTAEGIHLLWAAPGRWHLVGDASRGKAPRQARLLDSCNRRRLGKSASWTQGLRSQPVQRPGRQSEINSNRLLTAEPCAVARSSKRFAFMAQALSQTLPPPRTAQTATNSSRPQAATMPARQPSAPPSRL